MRKRLRPAHSPERLAEIYAKPHDHHLNRDHELRVATTIDVGKWITPDGIEVGADLSCGNGEILKALNAKRSIYGDYAPGYEVTGPIEETVKDLPRTHLFVCAETIEHLDDPDAVLWELRRHTQGLLLSTPVDAWTDTNEEHYWAWSRADVEDMLHEAGFMVMVYAETDLRPCGCMYSFGIWGCR